MSLLACAFIPVYKGSLKYPAKCDSYRAIAGSSLILKLFDNVVLLLWHDYLENDSLQFGFKSGASTIQCSWMVQEVASYFLRKGNPCIVTLIDCTKAFDLCKFSTLLFRVLMYIYEHQYAWVRWGDSKSSIFGIVNGTRQGSVLIPTIFAIYIDDLLKEL